MRRSSTQPEIPPLGRRALCLAAMVCVLLVLFAARSSAEQGESRPLKDWVVYAPYWSAEGELQTTLHLHNNHVQDALVAQVEMYSAEGVLLATREIELGPLSSLSILLNSWIDSDQPGSRHGGAALRYRAPAMSAVRATLSVTDERHSLSFNVPFFCELAGGASQVLESAWWFPFPKAQGRVVLFNTSGEEIAVTPTLFVDAVSYELHPRSIAPKASAAIDLRQALGTGLGSVTHGGLRLTHTGAPNALGGVVLLYDERRGFSNQVRLAGHDLFHRDTRPALANPGVFTLNAPFVMLGKPPAGAGFAPGTSFTPWLLLRNTTDVNLALAARFTYMEGGAPVQVPLPLNVLFPQQTFLVNLKQFVAQGIIPPGVSTGAVSVSYEGYLNSVLMNIASLDLTGNFVQGAAITVGGAPRQAGAHWRTDGDYNTMVTVQNVDNDTATASVTVVLENGNRYNLPAVELAPQAITQFDLKAIQRQGQPDDEGHVWPATVMAGGLRIEAEDARRALAVDVAVFNTTLGTCEIQDPLCGFCAGVLAIVLLPPNLVGTVGQTQQYSIDTEWSDGHHHTMGADSYTSSSPAVINIDNSGLASLNNVGTTTLTAQAFLPDPTVVVCEGFCAYAIFEAIDDGEVRQLSRFEITVTSTPVTGETNSLVSGQVGQVQVKAIDNTNAVFTQYRGTVSFSSMDTLAVLPLNYAFTASDAGTHTFDVTLKTVAEDSPTRGLQVRDVSNNISTTKEIFVWFNPIATREGLVGFTTACGHVITANDHFVALPATGLCNVAVRLANGSLKADTVVLDVGPWCPNTPVEGGFNQCTCSSDRYWQTTGVPCVESKDCDANNAGIDLADGTFSDLGLTNNARIFWRFR